jgi:hypothetical protein
MYYVISSGTSITNCGENTPHPKATPFRTIEAAKTYAGDLFGSYGNHWQIIKTEQVWTTKDISSST